MILLAFLTSLLFYTACSIEDDEQEELVPSAGISLAEDVRRVAIRNSALVAFRFSGSETERWLSAPQSAFVEGYIRFPPELANDIFMGFDIELFEGVADPIRFEGADWMALTGITRSGLYFTPVGTQRSLGGVPSDASVSESGTIGFELQPNTWYRLRIDADFSTLRFIKLTIEGPEQSAELDFSQYLLDYPVFIPFDGRTLTFYFFALRNKELQEGGGSTVVHFDDIRAGIITESGEVEIFNDGCEDTGVVAELPITLPVSPLADIVEGNWYKENSDAIVTTVTGVARSGVRACAADARLE